MQLSNLPAEMCNFTDKKHQACSPHINNSLLSGESIGMVMHHVLSYVCHSRSQCCCLGTFAVLSGLISSQLINVALAESHGTRDREACPDNGGVSIMSASQDTATATQYWDVLYMCEATMPNEMILVLLLLKAT